VGDWGCSVRVFNLGLSSRWSWYHHSVNWLEGHVNIEIVWGCDCSILEEVFIGTVVTLSEIVVITWWCHGLREFRIIVSSKDYAFGKIVSQLCHWNIRCRINWCWGRVDWSRLWFFNWFGIIDSYYIFVIDGRSIKANFSILISKGCLFKSINLEGEVSHFNWWRPTGFEFNGISASS